MQIGLVLHAFREGHLTRTSLYNVRVHVNKRKRGKEGGREGGRDRERERERDLESRERERERERETHTHTHTHTHTLTIPVTEDTTHRRNPVHKLQYNPSSFLRARFHWTVRAQNS